MTPTEESPEKQLWLLVGGNGSGKSTFYQTQLEPLGIPFINADIILVYMHLGWAAFLVDE